MNTNEQLKPCPFCGGKAEIFAKTSFARGITRGWEFGIFCVYCDVGLRKTDYKLECQLDSKGNIVAVVDERPQAIEAWNRRANE